MQGFLLLQLLILLVVANGTAVVAKKLLGVAFARPLDGGAHGNLMDLWRHFALTLLVSIEESYL
jgi:hypothetical protein